MKDDEPERQLTLKERMGIVEEDIKERFGITSLHDLIVKPDVFGGDKTDVMVIASAIREYFETDEENRYLRWLPKANFSRRRDAEVAALIKAYTDVYEYDILMIERETWCKRNGIAFEDYLYLLRNHHSFIMQTDANIRRIIEDDINEFSTVVKHIMLAYMPASTAIDGKRTHQFVDGITARPKIIEQKMPAGLLSRFKKKKEEEV